MKWLVIGLISLFIVGCGTTVYQLKAPCNKTVETVFQEVTGLLIKEGFNVTFQSIETGLLHAETTPEHSIWTGENTYYKWDIQITNNEVVASCVLTTINKNAFGATLSTSEQYINDEWSEDVGYYWNIRDGLEDLCGSRITIIKSKKGENKTGRKRNRTKKKVDGQEEEIINE